MFDSSSWVPDWSALFVPSVPLPEMFLRGTIMYLGLIVLFRFVPTRQTGNIGLPDILLVVLIADAAQNGMSREYRSVTEGLFLVCTLIFWDYTLDRLTFAFPVLRRWFQPQGALLIRRGQLQEDSLREQLVTRDELMSLLRQQGVKDPGEVEEARIEASGQVSVIKKDE